MRLRRRPAGRGRNQQPPRTSSNRRLVHREGRCVVVMRAWLQNRRRISWNLVCSYREQRYSIPRHAVCTSFFPYFHKLKIDPVVLRIVVTTHRTKNKKDNVSIVLVMKMLLVFVLADTHTHTHTRAFPYLLGRRR
jgi:hypothetical protein